MIIKKNILSILILVGVLLFVGTVVAAPQRSVSVLHSGGEIQEKRGSLWPYDFLTDSRICLNNRCVSSWLDTSRGSYSWKMSEWSACNASCGGGVQVRNIWCEREDGAAFRDSLCSSSSQPETTQSCNTQACPANISPDYDGGPYISSDECPYGSPYLLYDWKGSFWHWVDCD